MYKTQVDTQNVGILSFMKMKQKKDIRLFSVGILGSTGVGKISIISQFLHSKFHEEHMEHLETAHDFYSTEIKTETSKICFNIIDTAGHSDFTAMNTLAKQRCDAFILVFSLNDPHSFENVGLLQEEIFSLHGNIPIVIARNKTDIEPQISEIDRTTLESIVSIDWNCRYMEVSAKENRNITPLFEDVLSTLASSKNKKQKTRKNSCLIS